MNMPLKKSTRRRWPARKGPMRRRRPQARNRRRVATRPTLLKRTFGAANIVPNTTTGVSTGAFQFMLADLPNYTEYVNMWDKYKLAGVRIRFIPANDNSPVGTASTSGIGTFSWCLDYNDANAPAGLDDIMQYPGMRMKRPTTPFSVFIKPKFEAALYQGATTGYRATTGYVDTASSTVRHYGLKYCLHDTVAANASIRVYMTYYLALKEPK